MEQKMNEQVLLSIVVPVYNTREFLERCIESVLSQTYENFEMILVNDGSTDGSEKIIQKYVGLDSRVKFVNCEQNGGLFQARLRGYEQAKGKYICSLDSDDFVGRDYYRSMLQAALESDAEIVISNMTTYYQKSGKKYHRTLGNYAIRDICLNDPEGIRSAYFGMDAEISQWWFVWNKIYKKELWDRCYDMLMQYTGHHIMLEDFVYGSIFMTNTRSVYSIEENNYFYVRHEGASTGSGGGAKKLYKNINDIVDAFEFLDKYFAGREYEKDGKNFVRKAAKRWKKTWGASVNRADITETDKKELMQILNKINVPDEAKLNQFEDVWKGYFYRETSKYNPLRQEIKDRILDNETRVICVQLPDVLCETLLHNEQIKELLIEKWEDNCGSSLEGILQASENYLNFFSKEGVVKKSECDAIEHFVDNGRANDIGKILNQLREQFSYVRQPVAEICKYVDEIGKEVIFVNTSSRIYSNSFEQNIKGEVFNAFAYQEDIFDVITNRYDCEKNQILFIGNGKNPTEKYLETNQIPFIKIEDRDDKFEKEHTSQLYDKNKFYNGLLDVRKDLCCSNPFEAIGEKTDYLTDPQRIGEAVLGPHVVSVMGWLLNIAQRTNRNTIYFWKENATLYFSCMCRLIQEMGRSDINIKEIDVTTTDIYLYWIIFPDQFDEKYAQKNPITVGEIFLALYEKKMCGIDFNSYLFDYDLKESDKIDTKQKCKELQILFKEEIDTLQIIKRYLQSKYKLDDGICFGKKFSNVETSIILNYGSRLLFTQLYPADFKAMCQYVSYYDNARVIDYPIRTYFENDLFSENEMRYGERFLQEGIRKGIFAFIKEYMSFFGDRFDRFMPYFCNKDSVEYDHFVSYPQSTDRLLFDIVCMIDTEKKSKPQRLLSNIWWSKLDEKGLLPSKKKESSKTKQKVHTTENLKKLNLSATYYKGQEFPMEKFSSLERMMLYYLYDKDRIDYKLHKYAWTRHTLLPLLHIFGKGVKKDRKCLYIATSNYNLLCCMIHKEIYHKNDACDLALSIWRKDKVPELRAEKFFENIYIMDDNHFRNMTWQLDKKIEGKSREEIDYLVEGFYDEFYEELPVRILRYCCIVATNTIMPVTVLLQKLHLPYDCMEEAAGLYSDNSLLMNNMRGFHPKSEIYALDKYKMFDMNHVKGKRFVNLSAQSGDYSKKNLVNFNVVEELRRFDSETRKRILKVFSSKEAEYGESKSTCLILTYPLSTRSGLTEEEYVETYLLLMDMFGYDKVIHFKPHPDDKVDHQKYFSSLKDFKLINRQVLSELLEFETKTRYVRAVTTVSTSTNNLQNCDEKVVFGKSFEDDYKKLIPYFSYCLLLKKICRLEKYKIRVSDMNEEILNNIILHSDLNLAAEDAGEKRQIADYKEEWPTIYFVGDKFQEHLGKHDILFAEKIVSENQSDGFHKREVLRLIANDGKKTKTYDIELFIPSDMDIPNGDLGCLPRTKYQISVEKRKEEKK